MLAITSWSGSAIPFHVLCSVDNDRDGGRRGGGGKGVFEKGKGRGVMKDERGRGGGREKCRMPNLEWRTGHSCRRLGILRFRQSLDHLVEVRLEQADHVVAPGWQFSFRSRGATTWHLALGPQRDDRSGTCGEAEGRSGDGDQWVRFHVAAWDWLFGRSAQNGLKGAVTSGSTSPAPVIS